MAKLEGAEGGEGVGHVARACTSSWVAQTTRGGERTIKGDYSSQRALSLTLLALLKLLPGPTRLNAFAAAVNCLLGAGLAAKFCGRVPRGMFANLAERV